MTNMRLLKREHPQRNTDFFSKKKGKAEWILGMFIMQFILVIVVFEMQMIEVRILSDSLEDAIAAGGLASVLIDIERFGRDGELVIADPLNTYDIYKQSLGENLGDKAERIVIESYVIYNVQAADKLVDIIEINEEGIAGISTGRLGEVMAPNGKLICNTGIYSEITYPVEGVFGLTTTASKNKLIEIKNEEGERKEDENQQ